MPQHKRWILVPKTTDALAALDLDEATNNDLLQWELATGDFNALWTSGIFSKLSTSTHTSIDDYEDSALAGENLTLAREVVDEAILKATDVRLVSLLDRLRGLVDAATTFKTALHFFF
jgi:hypothetical protein